MRFPKPGDAFVVHMAFLDEGGTAAEAQPGTLLVYLRDDPELRKDVFVTNRGEVMYLARAYRIDRTFAHPLGDEG